MFWSAGKDSNTLVSVLALACVIARKQAHVLMNLFVVHHRQQHADEIILDGVILAQAQNAQFSAPEGS